MRETAGKLLQYVDVENPQVTERQEVDYYLANTKVYQEVVEHLPEKRNLIPMAAACRKPRFIKRQWIVSTLQNSAIQMMRKRLFISIAR